MGLNKYYTIMRQWDYICFRLYLSHSLYGPLFYKFLWDYHFACVVFVYNGSTSCKLSDPTFVSLSSTCAHVDIKSSDPTFAALITPCTHVQTKLCDPTFALLSYTCAHVHIKWHSKQEVGEYSIKKEAAWKTVFHRGMTAGINVLLTFGANFLSDCLLDIMNIFGNDVVCRL